LRIESILESGEHVIKRFSGTLNGAKGTWFVTNLRLVHLPAPVVKMDLKKTIIGGALFGGIGGTLGTKVEMPESFEDYQLNDLISIDVETHACKAVFRTPPPSDKRVTLYIMNVKKPHDFRSEVINAKNKLEEEIAKEERAKAQIIKDEKIQKLSSEIEALQKELKELENKVKDLDLAYAIGRIDKETYLEKKKEEKFDEKKSILEAKKSELADRKEKYFL
jgi:hypothetical protein